MDEKTKPEETPAKPAAAPAKYKLNAMQIYNRVLRIINRKGIFKDRRELASLLKKLAKEVLEVE